MSLVVLDKRYLDRVWPTVSALLAPAVAHASEDTSLDHLQLRLRAGALSLLMWVDGDAITGAATIEFKDYPRQRVAFISFMGGEAGLTDPAKAAELQQWCREQGASAIEAWCHPGSARLFQRYGFQQKYIVTRCPI